MTNEQRQKVERKIVEKAIDTFIKAGYILGVNDGEETTVRKSGSSKQIMDALFTTDEEYLIVYSHKPGVGWRWFGQIMFVYGNDGYDVIADNTRQVDELLKPVEAYAASFDPANLPEEHDDTPSLEDRGLNLGSYTS